MCIYHGTYSTSSTLTLNQIPKEQGQCQMYWYVIPDCGHMTSTGYMTQVHQVKFSRFTMSTSDRQHGIHGVCWSLIDHRPVQVRERLDYIICTDMISYKNCRSYQSELFDGFSTRRDISKPKLNSKQTMTKREPRRLHNRYMTLGGSQTLLLMYWCICIHS